MAYSKEKKVARTAHLGQEPPIVSVPVNRQRKIKELRETVKLAREDFKAFLEIRTEGMTEAEKKDNSNVSVQKQAIILALLEDLKTTTLNKKSSRYFIFTPSPPSRRARKQFNKDNKIKIR